MNNRNHVPYRWSNFAAAGLLAAAIAGCGGGGGSGGGGAAQTATGPDSISSGAAALAASTSLTIAVTGVTISSPPVVHFTVTNQDGRGMNGITAADVRFNIAKLSPGANGEPGAWQNYINRSVNGAVEGTQERSAAGFAFGTLSNLGDGRYTYAFATDITSAAANPCPAPCTDADGKPLDIRYQPGLTHRVTVHQANRTYPRAAGVFDFVPAGGTPTTRDVVVTSTCNTCHYELIAHGTRVDTKFCVTCHNPGSWVAGTPNTTVDFKVMIHRIHYNIFNSINTANPAQPNFLPRVLPSVFAGTPYTIGSDDFSDPVFTQDVRNCTRCHDGTLSAQGDRWKSQPSIAACGSCHDNVYFGTLPDLAKPYQTKPHSGGVMTDNSTCALCHDAGRVADVTVAHNFPARFKAATAKFQLNILGATPTGPGNQPVVTFSVTDPTNGDAPYDIKAHPAFTAGSASTLSIKLAWKAAASADIGNDGSGEDFGQPISINALTGSVAGATPGTFTVTSPVAIPAGQTGTLRVMMDGHPAGDVTAAGTFANRLAPKSVFRDFAITGTVMARRTVATADKCNVCHDVLSLHGANRNDEIGVCVVCHNPNATDARRRPQTAGVLTGGVDGKLEEAIDFKTMIHAIHAGQASKGGYREKGIVLYGFGGTPNDFGKVVFPGRLNNCAACHVDSSYQLGGIWATPIASGILGTTFSTQASRTSAADNLRVSQIAGVCQSCHDSASARNHMTLEGANFSATQSTIDSTVVERCQTCHGVGRAYDVKTAHGVK